MSTQAKDVKELVQDDSLTISIKNNIALLIAEADPLSKQEILNALSARERPQVLMGYLNQSLENLTQDDLDLFTGSLNTIINIENQGSNILDSLTKLIITIEKNLPATKTLESAQSSSDISTLSSVQLFQSELKQEAIKAIFDCAMTLVNVPPIIKQNLENHKATIGIEVSFSEVLKVWLPNKNPTIRALFENMDLLLRQSLPKPSSEPVSQASKEEAHLMDQPQVALSSYIFLQNKKTVRPDNPYYELVLAAGLLNHKNEHRFGKPINNPMLQTALAMTLSQRSDPDQLDIKWMGEYLKKSINEAKTLNEKNPAVVKESLLTIWNHINDMRLTLNYAKNKTPQMEKMDALLRANQAEIVAPQIGITALLKGRLSFAKSDAAPITSDSDYPSTESRIISVVKVSLELCKTPKELKAEIDDFKLSGHYEMVSKSNEGEIKRIIQDQTDRLAPRKMLGSTASNFNQGFYNKPAPSPRKASTFTLDDIGDIQGSDQGESPKPAKGS